MLRHRAVVRARKRVDTAGLRRARVQTEHGDRGVAALGKACVRPIRHRAAARGECRPARGRALGATVSGRRARGPRRRRVETADRRLAGAPMGRGAVGGPARGKVLARPTRPKPAVLVERRPVSARASGTSACNAAEPAVKPVGTAGLRRVRAAMGHGEDGRPALDKGLASPPRRRVAAPAGPRRARVGVLGANVLVRPAPGPHRRRVGTAAPSRAHAPTEPGALGRSAPGQAFARPIPPKPAVPGERRPVSARASGTSVCNAPELAVKPAATAAPSRALAPMESGAPGAAAAVEAYAHRERRSPAPVGRKYARAPAPGGPAIRQQVWPRSPGEQ